MPDGDAASTRERRRRYRIGLSAELVAAVFLSLKGYRVLARRHKTPVGEVDLIAVRRGRVAFVEVKRRATLSDAEASVTALQRRRVRRAAELWLGRNPRYIGHQIGFDLVFLIPRRWPLHIENGL